MGWKDKCDGAWQRQRQQLEVRKTSLPNHLILPFEPLSTRSSGAAFDVAEVRTRVGVNIHVRIEEILCLEGQSGTAMYNAFERAWGVLVVHCRTGIKGAVGLMRCIVRRGGL